MLKTMTLSKLRHLKFCSETLSIVYLDLYGFESLDLAISEVTENFGVCFKLWSLITSTRESNRLLSVNLKVRNMIQTFKLNNKYKQGKITAFCPFIPFKKFSKIHSKTVIFSSWFQTTDMQLGSEKRTTGKRFYPLCSTLSDEHVFEWLLWQIYRRKNS